MLYPTEIWTIKAPIFNHKVNKFYNEFFKRCYDFNKLMKSTEIVPNKR